MIFLQDMIQDSIETTDQNGQEAAQVRLVLPHFGDDGLPGHAHSVEIPTGPIADLFGKELSPQVKAYLNSCGKLEKELNFFNRKAKTLGATVAAIENEFDELRFAAVMDVTESAFEQDDEYDESDPEVFGSVDFNKLRHQLKVIVGNLLRMEVARNKISDRLIEKLEAIELEGRSLSRRRRKALSKMIGQRIGELRAIRNVATSDGEVLPNEDGLEEILSVAEFLKAVENIEEDSTEAADSTFLLD